MILGILATLLATVPYFPSASSASDAWGLRRAYLGHRRVQLDIGALRIEQFQAALGVLGGHFSGGGQELEVTSGSSNLPRIVLRSGAGFPGSFNGRLGRLGFTRGVQGYTFLGRRFAAPGDGFVATFEDPDRGGLPVTIFYANTPEALTGYLTEFRSATRPGFRAFRSGKLELLGHLNTNASLREGSLVDRRKLWRKRFSSDERLNMLGFRCRVPAQFEVERAVAYLNQLIPVRLRALTWVREGGEPVERSTSSSSNIELIVHGSASEMSRLTGSANVSFFNPITKTIHVLLSPEVPNDGGAAVAEVAVRRMLGPPSTAWLGSASGIFAAGSWWGRDLESLGARLLSAGVVPELEILLAQADERFLSPHVRKPLLGLFFGYLLEAKGTVFLRNLWEGDAKVDMVSEQLGWQSYLKTLQPRERRPVRRLKRGSWRAGCTLVLGETKYSASALPKSFDDLVATGATSISLRSVVYRDRPEPEFPGALHPLEVSASEADVSIADAAAISRARGFELGLEMHLLANPHGGYTAESPMPELVDCKRFFDDYEPFLVHEALLADLIGADRFSIGTGLWNTSTPSRIPLLTDFNRERWSDLLGLARALFDGQVIYIARSVPEAEQLLFGEQLDVVSLELFPALKRASPTTDSGKGLATGEARLVSQISGRLVQAAKLAQSRGVGLWLSGVGFSSTQAGWQRTDVPSGKASPEMQFTLYQALISALNRLNNEYPELLVGVQLWNWNSDPFAGGSTDRGYTPQGKPAIKLLPKLFSPPAKK